MKECKCGKTPPCYGSLERAIYEEAKKVNDEWEKSRARHGKLIAKLRNKLMEGGFLDDTHDKVYELNQQMCDIERGLSNDFLDMQVRIADKLAKDVVEGARTPDWAKNMLAGIPEQLSRAKYEILDEMLKEKNRLMEEKKTKKMTKDEAFEWLKCKKVDTIGLGKEVQKKLFDCGVKWANGKCEYYDFSDYLLIESDGDLYHCGNCGDAYFRMHHFEEIYAHDILSIEIVDENKTEEEKALDKISCLGAQIVDILLHMKGHHHVTITETTVALHDEGMCLFHSDPF